MNSDNKLKEIGINISTICYFHDIVNINEFDFGNILLYEKSYKNFLICDMHTKLYMVQSFYVLFSIKLKDILAVIIALNTSHYFVLM